MLNKPYSTTRHAAVERSEAADEARAAPTFPPPGWCFMLSVEPILERALRMSGAGAVLGRAVVLEVVVVVDVVEEAALAVRGTAGFFSGAVPEVEDAVAGLAAVVRVRDAAVVVTELRVVVVVLGLVESAGGRVIQSFIVSTLEGNWDNIFPWNSLNFLGMVDILGKRFIFRGEGLCINYKAGFYKLFRSNIKSVKQSVCQVITSSS